MDCLFEIYLKTDRNSDAEITNLIPIDARYVRRRITFAHLISFSVAFRTL